MSSLKEQLRSTYLENEVVLEDDIVLVVDSIYEYVVGLSKYTHIDINYFMNILKYIDFIRFSIDSDIKKLDVDNDFCRSINFSSDGLYGIIAEGKDDNHRIYNLTNELNHFFIKNYLNNGSLESRDLHINENTSRLYEGICEYITQGVWKIINPDIDSIGVKNDRYYLEVFISGDIIDAIGRDSFLSTIFIDPNSIFDMIRDIKYKDDNLLDYIDKSMKPLVKYRGSYDKSDVDCFDILDSFEAVSDCNKILRIKGGSIYGNKCS